LTSGLLVQAEKTRQASNMKQWAAVKDLTGRKKSLIFMKQEYTTLALKVVAG
jgi:hypothetical protein